MKMVNSPCWTRTNEMQESKSCALPLGERAIRGMHYVYIASFQYQLLIYTIPLIEIGGI